MARRKKLPEVVPRYVVTLQRTASSAPETAEADSYAHAVREAMQHSAQGAHFVAIDKIGTWSGPDVVVRQYEDSAAGRAGGAAKERAYAKLNPSQQRAVSQGMLIWSAKHKRFMPPSGVSGMPGAAAAASLEGAFRQAAGAMGFQPPWGQAGLGAAAAGLPNAAVGTFNMVLVSKLTQYDKRLSRKQPNAYRLGHLLKAANAVAKATKRYAERSDPEAMRAFLGALEANFAKGGYSANAPFAISAVENVKKQVLAYLATGKTPSLVR